MVVSFVWEIELGCCAVLLLVVLMMCVDSSRRRVSSIYTPHFDISALAKFITALFGVSQVSLRLRAVCDT